MSDAEPIDTNKTVTTRPRGVEKRYSHFALPGLSRPIRKAPRYLIILRRSGSGRGEGRSHELCAFCRLRHLRASGGKCVSHGSLAGAVAGAISAVISQPVDTVKAVA